MAYSLKSLLVLSVTACIGLSACNKLGYGEPRTAPDGQAMLGPKRMPQLNGPEIQKQRAMQGGQRQQAMQQRPPTMPMMPPQMMQQPQVPQPQVQQMAPQVPANYPVTPTPYGASPQSYAPQSSVQPQQVPQQSQAESYMQAPQAEMIQQSSYDLPQDYAPGSYYNAGATNQKPVSAATDYYTQDITQNHSPAAAMGAGSQQWYAPAAPVGEVYGAPLPVSAPGTYSAGYGMDAAYGRYPNQADPLAVLPQQDPSFYQPMTARAASTYPARDPYAQETAEPAYNNAYYGGEGMPQLQMNQVSQQQYLEETLRRPLEEPPMLTGESALPNPNRHSMPYYGGY